MKGVLTRKDSHYFTHEKRVDANGASVSFRVDFLKWEKMLKRRGDKERPSSFHDVSGFVFFFLCSNEDLVRRLKGS